MRTDLNSATAPGTQAPPANTKGQRTNIEVMPSSKAAKAAKPAAKQSSLHARRRITRLRSQWTKCSKCTRKYQDKRHQSTVKANNSNHESQEKLSIEHNNANSAKQKHNASQKHQHARPVNKGTMLDFLKPRSNKTQSDANTAHTCAQTTKRRSYETEPHLTQCSKDEQTGSTQTVTGKIQKAEGAFSDRREVIRVNVMGTTTVQDEFQNLAQEQKPCIMVLTETKLTELEQDRKMLNNCLPDHTLHHSRPQDWKTADRLSRRHNSCAYLSDNAKLSAAHQS